MTDTATMKPETARPWSVVMVRGGRIIGDETADGIGSIQIHGPNGTVASVYRKRDARLIANAVNGYDALKAVEAAARGAVTLASQGLTPHIQLQAISDALDALTAIRKPEVAR